MGSVIGYVGLSHLGIISSAATAAKGFMTVAYDADAELCQSLESGRLPIHEPGLADLLSEHRQRLTFTSDAGRLRGCDVVIVALDIPTDDQGASKLQVLDQLIASVRGHLNPNAVVVVLSQVCPGYTRGLRNRSAIANLYYQVETLVFGQAVERAMRPERIIIGCGDPAAPLPASYAELLAAFGCPLLPMRYESAELAKTAINLMLVTSVTATNTLAELCAAIGADWSEIKPALRLDRRIGPYAYLDAGLGLSGGNLERDLQTLRGLAVEAGTDAGLIDVCIHDSQYRSGWVLRQLSRLVPVNGHAPVVAIWGLAYKPNTRSTKNAPGVGLIRNLAELPGRYAMRVYDPEASFPGEVPAQMVLCNSPLEACHEADALVVMTPWRVFGQTPMARVKEQMRGSVVIDPWDCLPATDCHAAGIVPVRLGVRRASFAA
jgi:UDPglucose 6-dehydrogenase